MSSIKDKQQDAMASIDTAKAMVDKVLTIMGILTESPSVSLTFATNPIGFILQLLKHLGVTYEELRDYIANFLIYVVPVLEIGIKAILLTNLKNMISCSVDPRIPEKYRERLGCDVSMISGYGIDISIESIDFLDKLSENPLSEYSDGMYFGLEGIDDVYKFARAEDFDAFLWFVIHKGKFPSSSPFEDITGEIHGIGAKTISSPSILDAVEVTFDATSPSSIMLGNTFEYSAYTYSPISMCIDRKYDEENNIVSNILVPTSSNQCSVNWYVRRADYFTKNLGFGEKKFETRNFSDEIAICNLQHLDTASSNVYPSNGFVNNIVKFTIKPRPFIHIPNVDCGEKPWGFVPLLFDSQGNYNVNGKYTIGSDIQPSPCTTGDTNITYVLDADTNIKINIRTGKVTTEGDVRPYLIECYKGLTVYEFNYDFVMGMKLFDAKVMATTLLDTLVNTRLGINLNIAKKHEEATDKIKEIIKNIINSDDSSVEDCYFSFDNQKYDELLKESEKRRAAQYNFGNSNTSMGDFSAVRSILEEYDDAATLEEQVEVISRAITQASVTISDGADDSDKYGIEFGFVFDLIENLVLAIVNAVLTPKVLLLLEVNRQIMGGNWKAFTIEDLLKAMQGIIISIIKEVRDLVIQELLKLVLKYLQPLKEMIESILLREQIENYTAAINDIIRNCPVIWFEFGNQNLETKLDTVDYADIDVSSTRADDKPINKC